MRDVEGLAEDSIEDNDKLRAKLLKFTKEHPEPSVVQALEALDCTTKQLREAVRSLSADGYDIHWREDSVKRDIVPPAGNLVKLFKRISKSGTIKIGVLGDNQLGNMKARLDVLEAAYDHFAAEDIDTVLHTGNMIDGYNPRINFGELIPEAGYTIDDQCAYAAEVYPLKDGITTYWIDGECHEGWWYRQSGVNVGRAMEMRFKDHGRHDLVHIGHLEADVELRVDGMPDSVHGPIARVSHPGGGTAYALSYKTQKSAESFQGGEKPQIQFVGHFHKFDWNYHREVHNVMTGTTCDQTKFMRKHNIPAHVGYLIAELKILPEEGTLESLKIEWVPWYDRGFYESWSRPIKGK